MVVDAATWWGLDDDAVRSVAETVADLTGATLVSVRRHTFAGHTRPVARYDVAGQAFAFVPGGEVTVGYDGGRFVADPQQLASYAETAREFGLDGDIREFVDAMTSPARTVRLPGLLVAVHAVELIDEPSYQDEVARLSGLGQRLLTPDEWEHACGAGADTLFRWGDRCPPGGDPWSATTGPHREPNAFGLEIGQDPYRDERTADPAVICGGDGGSAVCGGSGEFAAWLTVATAFRDPQYAAFVLDEGEDLDTMLVRPAIEVPHRTFGEPSRR